MSNSNPSSRINSTTPPPVPQRRDSKLSFQRVKSHQQLSEHGMLTTTTTALASSSSLIKIRPRSNTAPASIRPTPMPRTQSPLRSTTTINNDANSLEVTTSSRSHHNSNSCTSASSSRSSSPQLQPQQPQSQSQQPRQPVSSTPSNSNPKRGSKEFKQSEKIKKQQVEKTIPCKLLGKIPVPAEFLQTIEHSSFYLEKQLLPSMLRQFKTNQVVPENVCIHLGELMQDGLVIRHGKSKSPMFELGSDVILLHSPIKGARRYLVVKAENEYCLLEFTRHRYIGVVVSLYKGSVTNTTSTPIQDHGMTLSKQSQFEESTGSDVNNNTATPEKPHESDNMADIDINITPPLAKCGMREKHHARVQAVSRKYNTALEETSQFLQTMGALQDLDLFLAHHQSPSKDLKLQLLLEDLAALEAFDPSCGLIPRFTSAQSGHRALVYDRASSTTQHSQRQLDLDLHHTTISSY